jgi:hypothetical protein
MQRAHSAIAPRGRKQSSRRQVGASPHHPITTSMGTDAVSPRPGQRPDIPARRPVNPCPSTLWACNLPPHAAFAMQRIGVSDVASVAIGGYREGWSELLGFEPIVTSSMTISVTSLVSGSINTIRSGSFTNSSCFASGTRSLASLGSACAANESGSMLPTCGCTLTGAACEGEAASPWLTVHSCVDVRLGWSAPGPLWAEANPILPKIARVITPA